jgi:integrase
MKLTKPFIDKLQYGKEGNKPHIVFDSEIRGFAVRVYPSGEKSFLIDYRFQGRQRRMVLGKYGVITLKQARDRAKSKLVDVLNGHDPIEDKKKKQSGETIEKLCMHFLENYAKVHKRSWKEDERRIEKHIKPAIGKLRIQSVKRSDIQKIHNNLGKEHPYEANRVLALLSVMFQFGEKNGFFIDNITNPARGIKKFNEHKRDRWVKPDELPMLILAINEHENIYIRSALWLYLLTGLRKNELLRIKWQDIDLTQGELRLPETKSGKVHYVPLSRPAISILEKIPRLEANPYVIPGRKQGQHLVNIDVPWREIRKKANLEDVRLHDLRRTVGSWLATSGHSLQVIGKILNHADIGTTQKVYAHLAQDPLKKAMEEHGEKISSLMKV